MLYLFFAFLAVVLLYAVLVILYVYGWNKPSTVINLSVTSSTFVTVVVALRNEAVHLPSLLHALQQQTYNSFQVLFVNDHSDDESETIFNSFCDSRFSWITADGMGKKAALRQAIMQAKGQLILTTDADVLLPPTWVATMVHAYEKTGAQLLIGPLSIKKGNFFQNIDYFSIEGVTHGSAQIGCPVMCSGANLAFSKEWYQRCLPYLKFQVPSGDDMFLLEATNRLKGKVVSINHDAACVYIRGCSSIHDFFSQRSRWVSKSSHYTDVGICFTAVLVALTQLVCFVSMLLAFWHPFYLFTFLVKFVVDVLLIGSVAHHHKKYKDLFYYPVVAVLYPIYVLLVMLLTLFPLRWKKRNI